jgi:CHAT domain-containing protein
MSAYAPSPSLIIARSAILVFLILQSLFAVFAATKQASEQRMKYVSEWPPASGRRAVVIGVQQYRDKRIRELIGASGDARRIEFALVQYLGIPYPQMDLFVDESPKLPTRDQILKQLADIKGETFKDGALVFAFIGRAIERNGEAYLLPQDAQIDDDTRKLEETCLSLTALKQAIKDSGASQAMILLETRAVDDENQQTQASLHEALVKGFGFNLSAGNLKAFSIFAITGIAKGLGSSQLSLALTFQRSLLRAGADKEGNIILADLAAHFKRAAPQPESRKIPGLISSPTSSRPPSAATSVIIQGNDAEQVVIASRNEFNVRASTSLAFPSSSKSSSKKDPPGPPVLYDKAPVSASRDRPSDSDRPVASDLGQPRQPLDRPAASASSDPSPSSSKSDSRSKSDSPSAAKSHPYIPSASVEHSKSMKARETISSSDDINKLEAYLREYPNGLYAERARSQIRMIQEALEVAERAFATIERYPAINCPDDVKTGQEFALQVSLTVEKNSNKLSIQSEKLTSSGALEITGAPAEMDIVLSAPDFDITKGSNIYKIDVPIDGDSTPAPFFLRAKPIEGSQQTAKVVATFWHEGKFLANVTREILIRNAQANAEPLPPLTQSQPSPSQPPQSQPPQSQPPQAPPGNAPSPVREGAAYADQPQKSRANSASLMQRKKDAPQPPKTVESQDRETRRDSFVIERDTHAPDMTIMIIENLSSRNPGTAQIVLDSPTLGVRTGTFSFQSNLSDWLNSEYLKFAQYRPPYNRVGKTSDGKTESVSEKDLSKARMRGFGLELYQKLAPPVFKEYFWELADRLGGDLQRIQIYASNPILPWELMRPVRPDGTGERNFLGVEFSIGRWNIVEGNAAAGRPPQWLALKTLVAIAPQYKGSESLPGQRDEMKALQGINSWQRMPGLLGSMQQLFQAFPEGIVHFAGHGRKKLSPENIYEYTIQLEDGELDLTTLRGMIRNRNKNRPLFFLNACDVGQVQQVANFVMGWAPTIIGAGASGYIGALWPVNDKGATDFSVRFYKQLQKSLRTGPAYIADILRDTRKNFLPEGDPSFLAYVYYGDPNLRLLPVKLPVKAK